MTTIEKINWLFTRCKYSVTIEHNPHRDYYQTIESYLRDTDNIEEIGKDVLEVMERQNVLIKIQAYPNSPGGFYVCYHYDLDKCLDEMISTIREQGPI